MTMFDKIAMGAGMDAYLVAFDQDHDLMDRLTAFTSAAEASMRERGKVKDGITVEQDGRWFTNDAAFGLNNLTGMFETTIIRKETP